MQTETRNRQAVVTRWLFSNVGIFIAIAAILIQTGRLMSVVDDTALDVSAIKSEMREIQTSVSEARIDLAVIKTLTTKNEKDISTLQSLHRKE